METPPSSLPRGGPEGRPENLIMGALLLFTLVSFLSACSRSSKASYTSIILEAIFKPTCNHDGP